MSKSSSHTLIKNKSLCALTIYLYKINLLILSNIPMIKNFKTVSMLLFLGAMSTGIANAAADMGVAGKNIVQQGSVCKGIVKDSTGEMVIGASVVV